MITLGTPAARVGRRRCCSPRRGLLVIAPDQADAVDETVRARASGGRHGDRGQGRRLTRMTRQRHRQGRSRAWRPDVIYANAGIGCCARRLRGTLSDQMTPTAGWRQLASTPIGPFLAIKHATAADAARAARALIICTASWPASARAGGSGLFGVTRPASSASSRLPPTSATAPASGSTPSAPGLIETGMTAVDLRAAPASPRHRGQDRPAQPRHPPACREEIAAGRAVPGLRRRPATSTARPLRRRRRPAELPPGGLATGMRPGT